MPSRIVLAVVAPASVEPVAPCPVPPALAVAPVDGVAPPFAAHVLLNSVVGDGPAEASAARHEDPEGVPLAPLPLASLDPKSSETVEGELPQLVPRPTSVGTPGDASAVEQVEAAVGSSNEPIPYSEAVNHAVPSAMTFARTRPSDVEALVRLASASADGPVVVGLGADPSGVEGLGSEVDALVGTVAVVPGPVAVVELLEGPVEPGVVVELDAAMGSLIATVAGPASPPLADPDPPTVEL